jgi:DNA-binding NarL/FixJ family response regulator
MMKGQSTLQGGKTAMAMPSSIKVALVNKSQFPAVHLLLLTLLPPLALTMSTANEAEFRQMLGNSMTLDIDVALMSLQSVKSLAPLLKSQFPSLAIMCIVETGHTAIHIAQAFSRGARGFIREHDAVGDYHIAITNVHDKRAVIDAPIAQAVGNLMHKKHSLTQIQSEILRDLIQGQTPTQIAQSFSAKGTPMTPEIVERHIYNIIARL